MYLKILLDSIQREIDMTDYIFFEEDRILLEKMLDEINDCADMDFEYLAELDAFTAPGSGPVIAKYITHFKSEATKAILISQIAMEKTKDCDKLIFELYSQFKKSTEYIPGENKPASAHIYVRYDNAFRKIKPKKYKKELVELIRNPRDAFYLPFTTRMLASWKIPEVKDILIGYLDDSQISAERVGLKEEGTFYPSLDYIRKDLKFTVLDGLKYYPMPEVVDIIREYTKSDNADIKMTAEKSLKRLV